MALLNEYSELLAGLTYDTLPADVVDETRRRIFDTLGALKAGLATPDGMALQKMTDAITRGAKPTLVDTIRLVVAATRSTELDDIDIACCSTAGSMIVPSAVAIARDLGVDDKTLITSIVAGYDAALRLGRACDGAVQQRLGMWPTALGAPFGVAAIAAKQMGLSAAQMLNALTIALLRSTKVSGRSIGGTMGGRWYILGAAAVEGYAAAEAAAAGVGGDPEYLGEPFAKIIGLPWDEKIFRDGMGAHWCVMDLDTKPFPTSRQGMSSVDAWLRTPKRGSADDIESLEVAVPQQYRQMVEGQPGWPKERLGAVTSSRVQIAVAAYEPDRIYDILREGFTPTPGMRALAEKIKVVDDPELSRIWPKQWSGRVTTRWKGGAEEKVETRDPEGSAAKRFGWPELQRKYDRILGQSRIADAAWTRSLMETCQKLGTDRDKRSADLLALAARQPVAAVGR